MAPKRTIFLLVVVLSIVLQTCVCAKKKGTTTVKYEEKDDDSDFSISLLDDVNGAENKTERPKSNGLAGAILKAVQAFASDRRSRTVDLRTIIPGFGFGNIFRIGNQSPPKKMSKRSTPDNDFLLTFAPKSPQDDNTQLSFDNLFDDDSSEKGVPPPAKSENLFESLEEEDKNDDLTPRSNINKIPKKELLSRKIKSVDDLFNSSSDPLKLNFRNASGIEGLLNVYSVNKLIANWEVVKNELGPKCRRDMAHYLRALIEDKFWALKMDDASGRYTSGYFWGNSYWSGSSTLCMQTLTQIKESHAITENSTQMEELGMQESTPFEIAFFVVKLKLNSSLSLAGPKIVHLGLCLPESCMNNDVGNVVENGGSVKKSDIISIRDPAHNHYDMFSDVTFQILVGVTLIVSSLIIVGTIYELILNSRYNKLKKIKQMNHALHMNIAPVTDIPAVKISNGKSIYSVNGISNNNNNSEERLNIEPPIVEEQPHLGILSELILSFSLVSNMKTICDQSVGSDTIPTIHGLRSISMVWVILGHSCIVAFKYSDNPELRKVVEKEFLFQTVTNGTFSVDTFFCISGILVSFIYFRTNAKGNLDRLTKGTRGFTSGFLQFIGLLGYRFARLTAPYLFMLGVVQVSMKWFHYNSVYEPPTDDHLNCPNYWWRNALYINTLFPVEEMCMLWSWYLADDSQFYVLGAIILILAASHFKTAAGALVVFLFSSWITTGYVAFSNNHMPSSDDPFALFDKIYDKPWTRLGPYLVGMATGWFLYKIDCRMRMSKITAIGGWIVSSGMILSLIYGLYNTELSPVSAAAYSSLSHTAWAIAISWIVVACSTGHGGYVNSLLSATILYPFSRVTYCAYLVHPLVIRFLVMHTDHPIHLGKDMMAIIFLGQMVASYLLSFVISLTFEAPIVTMLKIIGPNRRRKLQ